jgi:hypothetical protein
MYNKKTLSKATAELDKAKAPKKPKDIITDPMGQWKYPGLPTRIPGNDITMQGVGYPVLGVANNGQRKIMLPGADYTFPGADYVDEYPQMKKGGERKRRKTKSITGINKIMLPNPLLRNYKNRVYDPNVDYFQDGGVSSLEGDLISKVVMERNKDKDFVQRAYALGENPGTPMFNVFEPDEFGQTMSHKMAWGEDENGQAYMFPTVMNPKNEAIKVPNQYADYISNEGYKRATGMIPEDEYIEAELTDDEIEEYRKGGFIVEDISVPELNQAKKGKSVNNTTSSKFTTYTAKNDKDYAFRKKAYDDSLALHKLNLEYEKLALKGNHMLTSNRSSYDPIAYKNLVNKMQYNDAMQETVIKNSNVPHKRVKSDKVQPGNRRGDFYYEHPRPTQMIIKPTEAADIIKKPRPEAKKTKVVAAPVKTNNKDTVIPTVAAVQSKYPVGYQPYSVYGKVLDPEVYGYAESLNGKPVQVSQFADTYGYKAKMDTYKKSGKYPWVKQKGGESKVILSKEHTDKKGNKTIVVTKDDGTKYTKVISKDGKVYNNSQAGLPPEMRAYDKKKAEWENRSSGAAQPVDDFWTLPIGMTSAGVKGAVGLAKGLTSLGRNAVKSSLVQAGKAGLKKSLIKSLPGSSINNLVASGFAGNGLTDVVTGEVAEPWKKANKSGKVSDYADAVAENMFTALDAYPLYNAAGKGVKQLGKYATTETPLKNAYKLLPEGTFKNYSKLKTKGKSYRVAGHDAHADFTESGLLRSKTNLPENATFLDRVDARPTAFPSFQKNYADLRYLPKKGGVIFETSLPTFARGDINPVTGGRIKGRHYAHRVIDPQTGTTLTEIPASDIDVYEGSANWLKGHKKISGKPDDVNNDFIRSGIGGMDMSRYEIKNPDFYTQMLNTYSNKVLSPTNKKFYTGLIETIKKQNGLVTERQYNELQRLKSGNFNFGKKAYKAGGIVADLTHAEIQDYIKQGYIVEDVE